MVKIPLFHCWECGFNSWLRKDLTCLAAKNKNNHKVAFVFGVAQRAKVLVCWEEYMAYLSGEGGKAGTMEDETQKNPTLSPLLYTPGQ